MAKLTLTDITSGYDSATVNAANNTLIEAAVENTLSRDGTSPNQMEANLDMNSNRIVNLLDAVNNQEPVTLAQAASIAGVSTPLTQAGVGAVLWPQSSPEVDASVTPTLYYYPPGYIERYGGVADGTTDSTSALETSQSVGRQLTKFYETGRTNVLNTYTGIHNYYIVRDAFLDRAGLEGPVNLTSDGTQTESVLRLGRDADNSNGSTWRYKEIRDVSFSGKQRADNCITFGADANEPHNLTAAWKLSNCYFERPNIAIWKQWGNLGNSFYDCSATSGNFGYHATGYPVQSTISSNQLSGVTVIPVVSTRDMNALDVVRILMDDNTIHQSTIASVDSTTQITIDDATDDTAAAGNYVKAYHPDDAIPVTLQHTGADRFYGGEWAGFRKAAFYIDGQQAQGNGGHIFDGVIIEGNPGFGLFVKDYNNAFNPMRLRNVWFEDNAIGSTYYNSYVDADGIAASQTPSGAGNFTLNGALTSGGTYTADTTNARQLSFTSASDESGDTYTITGTDADGNADTENVTGPNATTVYSTKAWRTVTQIATNGAATGAITIGVTAKVDLGDGQGPREPRDMYFENVDHVIVEGSQIRSVEIIDSYVELDRCKFDASNTKFTITNSVGGSHVVAKNIQIVQWGDDVEGAKDIVVESITGPLRNTGSVMRQWVAPQRNKFIRTPPGTGTWVGGDTFENGEDLIDITASSDLTATIVDGFTFPTASRYTLSVASNQYQTGATPSAASVSASKYIVATQEMRLVSGALSDVSYIGSETWTNVDAHALLNSHVGEWRTLAWVGKTDASTSGVCRMRIGVGAGGSAVVDFGANQVVEFDTEGEAIDYYNQRYLCVDLAQKLPQWPTASLPTVNALQPGLVAYDTTVDYLKLDQGTAWDVIASGATVANIPDLTDSLDGATFTGDALTTSATPTVDELEACVGALAGKINLIIAALEEFKVASDT